MMRKKTLETGKKSPGGRINLSLALIFLLFPAISLYAQVPPSAGSAESVENTATEETPTVPAVQTDAIRPLSEERRDIIKYGLESELNVLLAALCNEKNDEFIDDFAQVLEKGAGVKTVQEIFNYFTIMDSDKGVEQAEKYLENYQEQSRDIIIAALRYLSSEKNHGFQEKIFPLLDSANAQITTAAVRYLGKRGNAESAGKLLELFEKEETSQTLRGEIILALGELKDPETVPFLKSLLEDEDEDTNLRRYACDSLGKIGDEQALPAIRAALESPDNILRSYAISSLGYFPGEENATILLSALRDSFPRVRELAAQRLGDMEYKDAVSILIYRARRDPDKKVRQAAIASLAKIGTGEAVSFLQEFFESEKNPGDLRSFAAEKLTDLHPSAMKESAAKIMDVEWTRDSSPILDVIGRLVSQKEYSGFDDLYKRMLGHQSFLIQIYAIRGIQKNHISSLKAEVEALSAEGRHPQLRKNALSALESL
ncbi:MAG: HEAT repeat domain-containing protein [Spirochaetales bacterium]|jgi:HEAT repeat protein|nr:HEAT repeat domain-containing protein [Spirochaetales bacterium]